MANVRHGGETVRKHILKNIEKHPKDITKVTAKHFKISRQAVNRHVNRLIEENALSFTGNTRNRTYQLARLSEWSKRYEVTQKLEEHIVWSQEVEAILGNLPDNVRDIWHYGFTEMLNNVIDHSEGSDVIISITKTAVNTVMLIIDDGIGIFKKIQEELNLLDRRHAVLELSKGKLTTDPEKHSGEGIFFTSRVFDSFDILSSGVFFSHEYEDDIDWILEREKISTGTAVWMKINNHTSRTLKKVFDKFSSGEDYSFSKTVVPVKMAQYGTAKLISRSQAKRLLARVELFQTVIFDFTDVDMIGQAFADEIFRVFANQHPEIQLMPYKANSAVKRMIERAKARKAG